MQARHVCKITSINYEHRFEFEIVVQKVLNYVENILRCQIKWVVLSKVALLIRASWLGYDAHFGVVICLAFENR